MSFSLSSLFIVFGVFVLFYLNRRRARAYFLLVSSLVFYWISGRQVLYMGCGCHHNCLSSGPHRGSTRGQRLC